MKKKQFKKLQKQLAAQHKAVLTAVDEVMQELRSYHPKVMGPATLQPFPSFNLCDRPAETAVEALAAKPEGKTKDQ